jgi:two-component system, LytTR family, sensor kinase
MGRWSVLIKNIHRSFFHIIRKYSFDGYLSGILFLVLTGIGIARALQHVYVVDVYQSIQYSLWWHIPFNLFLWWSWFLFIPLIYWITIRLPLERLKLLHWVMVCFLLPMSIVIIRQALASLITVSVLAYKSNFQKLFDWRLFNNPWIWLDFIVYFAILIGVRVVEYQHKNKLTELRFTQLQTQLAQSHLNALKSQLHPHFLFNTLNTISTLILKEDDSEAERMLSLLNSFLKTTVFQNDRQEITLEEELRFVKDYLEIEKIRFSDKLEVKENIDGEALVAQVPNFLLQPIIENAIYHGIAPKTSNGILHISAKKEKGQLVICIEDNGPGLTVLNKKKSKEGVGLKITKERLTQLFGSNHLLELENLVSGGVRVTIRIPFIHCSPLVALS